MDVEIRKATPHDLKKIQAFSKMLFEKESNEFDTTLNGDWSYGKEGEEYFLKRMNESKKGFVQVAEVEGEVVGYFCGGIVEPEYFRNVLIFAEGESALVLPEYRGKGIGTKFIHNFFEWCRERGVKRIRFVAAHLNEKAMKLYRKLGFEDYVVILEKEL